MNERPDIDTLVATALANPGYYLLCDDRERPGTLIPVVSINGKIFAMQVDQELRPGRFSPTAYFKGPLLPDNWNE